LIPYNLFPTPVFKFTIDRSFTGDEWAFINGLRKENNNCNMVSEERYVLGRPELSSIKSFIVESLDRYFREVYVPKKDVYLRITQSWLNYTYPGQSHHQHSHSNSFVSGVLYMRASRDRDRINFHNTKQEQIEMVSEEYNMYNMKTCWFDVHEGDLLLFPSSLLHSVDTVKEGERVSLAFNTFPVGLIGNEINSTGLLLKE